MAQQTAVDYLMNELKSLLEIEWPMNIWLRKKIEQAKQMEKKQIVETFDNGVYVGTYAVDKDGEQYYNETYGENKD